METLLLIEIIITGLFFAVLGIKELIPKKNICAICFAVALTWIALLVLFWKKMFSDPILIALLIPFITKYANPYLNISFPFLLLDLN